jgi:ribosome-associated toxin RatA of RatAB toxin-antitoxin module
MVSSSAAGTFACKPEQFFGIVSDYEKYPEFINDIKQCKVIESEGNRKLVDFRVSGLRSFVYRLWITEEPPKGIAWKLESSDFFRTSFGTWDISSAGGNTRANYSVDVTFKTFVPNFMAQGFLSMNVANTLAAFQERVRTLVR